MHFNLHTKYFPSSAMDNSEAASTTQLDSGDIAAAVDVPNHLESGEPNIIALALAIHNHQEALKRGATATCGTSVAALAEEASTTETETETKTETETETKKTQEALKNKTKRLAEDTLVYNILQQYSPVDI